MTTQLLLALLAAFTTGAMISGALVYFIMRADTKMVLRELSRVEEEVSAAWPPAESDKDSKQ